MDIIREFVLLAVAAPFYLVVITAELIVSNSRPIKFYSLRGVLENVYLSGLNMSLDLLVRGVVLQILESVYQSRVVFWSEGIMYWIVLLFVEDFVYYWLHRVDHHCRLFWAVHVTHHSSEEFNLTVGFRSSVFQPFYRFVYFIPIAFIGFREIDIFLMYSLTQLYGILVHTRLINQLGFLELFMVTPSHHRVHHASNILYLDRNLGMVFIIWDRLFGTFTRETEIVKYGLTKPLKENDAISVVFHEWRELLKDCRKKCSWLDKLGYILRPPGWSHDGSKKTSDQLRQALRKPIS